MKPETVERVRQQLLERFRSRGAGVPWPRARRSASGGGRSPRTKQGRSPLHELARLLMQERRLTHDWAPSRPRSWSKATDRISDGMARTYRRARRSMNRAYDTQAQHSDRTGGRSSSGRSPRRNRPARPSTTWRKAVKAHRYQLQLLSNTWPAWVTARLPELERLGDLLGEEHDLTVLSRPWRIAPPALAIRPSTGVLAVLAARQQQLRDEARPLGETALPRTPPPLPRRGSSKEMRPPRRRRPQRGDDATAKHALGHGSPEERKSCTAV